MILIADLHSGKESDSFLVQGVPSQRLDLRRRLSEIGSRCRADGHALVIAGDVFNRVNPTSEVVAEWFQFLTDNIEVPIYIIPGNHDAGTVTVNLVMVRAAWFPKTKVFFDPTMEVVSDSTGESRVLFYPHLPSSRKDDFASIDAYCSGVDFLVTHGQVTDSSYENEIFFEAGNALSIDVAKAQGLIFAGHVHGQGVHTTLNGGTVVYPGSLTVNNFGEVDETKGYIEVSLSAPQEYVLKEFDTVVTPWRHVELDLTEKDETSIDESLVEEVCEGAVIKITVIAQRYGIVDESYIRTLFNKYGHVTRYETKVVGESVSTETPQKRLSHEKLLGSWLSESGSDAKTIKAANALGSDIIADVLSKKG